MADNVYTGFWTNWDLGQYVGATLTLPTHAGLILVSFLTLYVQFSGGCFWRVICFILHQLRSKSISRDGLFHQQQAILRNAVTAPNALWTLTKSAFAWRNRVNASFSDTLPLLLITTIHIFFFAAAGLLTSQVTTAGAGEALVRTGTCGLSAEVPDPRNANSGTLDQQQLLLYNAQTLWARLTLTTSQSYVRSCYSDDSSSGSSGCQLFVQSQLGRESSSHFTNASCPFGADSCSTATAVRSDSGNISSSHDLGINSPDSDTLTFRKVSSCAPINVDKYATNWTENVPDTNVGLANTSAKYYELGPSDEGCEGTNVTTKLTTFCVTKWEQQNLPPAYNTVITTRFLDNTTSSGYQPIPEFNISNADVSLISYLFNKLDYTDSVTDPLFLATNRTTTTATPLYYASQDLSILGCTEQYQFCNQANDRCTELTGLYTTQQAVFRGDLGLSPRQNATFQVMWKAAWATAYQWQYKVLGSSVLLANDWIFVLGSYASAPLPPTQWQDEAWNMHNLSLATFQRRINEYAAPENFQIRPGVSSLSLVQRPTDSDMLALCGLQKIRSQDHYSVSVMGMAIILIIGGIMILLDTFLIRQIFWFRNLTHLWQAKKHDWINSGTLQFQRQALEARGIGPWKTAFDTDIPILVNRNQKFAIGAETGTAIPLGSLVDEGGSHGLGHSTMYGGGGYSALPSQHSGPNVGVHVMDQDKKL